MNDIISLLRSSDPTRVAKGIVMGEEALTNASVAPPDRTLIRDALVAIADADPPHPLAGSAIWALGKLRDETLRPLFIKFLQRSVENLRSNGGDLWQAIIALADCGEETLNVSGGVLDFERNHSLAIEFLRREGLL
ncbi:MAG TPA: HEAT repeat domain-containing protein [Tepidisphaeraceae bacterium]